MTVILCAIFAILLFLSTALAAREVIGISPMRMSWGFHGLSLLLILVALATPGLWYNATTYVGDLWTAFEAMHKTRQGLHSSLDYFSPLGPAMEWIYRVALLIRPPSASALVLANAIVAMLCVALSVLLLRKRAATITVALVGLIAVTIALTPRDMDLPMLQSSFLAPYNRWGWALLMPVAMRAALPLTQKDRPGAVLFGLSIALLLLLKVTYALAAIGVFGLAVVLQPRQWKEGIVVALTLVAALIAADLLTHGQVRAYLADLRATAKMPSNGLRLGKLLLELPSFALTALGSCVLLLAAARADDGRPEQALLAHWRAALLACATGGAGLIVLMQNHYYTEASSLLLMPLIVAEWTGLFANWRGQPGAIWHRGGEWIALLILFTLARPAIDAGMVLAQPLQLKRNPQIAALAGTEFHDFVMEAQDLPIDGRCTDSSCLDYRRMISGRALLRQACMPGPGRSVLAANFANPYPALLGIPSPKASPIWLHENRSFSPAVHVPFARLFGDVDCLMQAKDEPNAALLMQIYGPDMRGSFRIVAENSEWVLWKRF